jgi:hypothetical protein
MVLEKFRSIDVQISSANQRIQELIIAKDGDANGRSLTIQITNRGEVVNTEELSVNLGWRHTTIAEAYGLENFNVIDETKGIYRLSYPTGMMRAGTIEATIQIIDGEHITELPNFRIKVIGSPIESDAIESDTRFTALQEVLQKAQSVIDEAEEMDGSALIMDNTEDSDTFTREVNPETNKVRFHGLSGGGGGMAEVHHDTTLTGKGLEDDPLKVANPGMTEVAHDDTLSGTGTTEEPLRCTNVALPTYLIQNNTVIADDEIKWLREYMNHSAMIQVTGMAYFDCYAPQIAHSGAEGGTESFTLLCEVLRGTSNGGSAGLQYQIGYATTNGTSWRKTTNMVVSNYLASVPAKADQILISTGSGNNYKWIDLETFVAQIAEVLNQ